MPHLTVTHIGTATMLLEIDGVRFLTDPVFDAPGRKYAFGWGTSSTHLETPALSIDALGRLDAVLLSHDQHGDNLDDAGRALLPSVPRVITTHVAAKRLGLSNATGLRDFESTKLGPFTITGTPARHGPPGSLPIVGHVTGFLIEGGSLPGPIYISGDTVWFDGVAEVARRFRPVLAFLHLGNVGFGISGPLAYTFDAKDAAKAAKALGVSRVIPLHYEGWTHFRQQREAAAAVLSAELGDKVQWLERSTATRVEL